MSAESEERFNSKIFRVCNEMLLKRDIGSTPFIIYADPVKAIEKTKIFETIDGKHIKKDNLLKVVNIGSEICPRFEVYCPDGQQEMAMQLVKEALAKHIDQGIKAFAQLKNAIENVKFESPRNRSKFY